MKVLLIYGTTEGQTQKVATFVAAYLAGHGHLVRTVDASDRMNLPDPCDYDAVLVAASLHVGRYQSDIVRFVRTHIEAIRAKKNAFISVSLAIASADRDDADGLRKCVADFIEQTGWSPQRIHHVAGAFRYTEYDFFKRWAMKYIAHRKGAPTDTSCDYELTDWDDLAEFADSFAL